MDFNIVIDMAVVSGATVILSFVLNQALKWAGIDISVGAKKAIVFAVALGLTAYFAAQGGFQLPDLGSDPMGFAVYLAGFAAAGFKIAQEVYDHLWQGLLKA